MKHIFGQGMMQWNRGTGVGAEKNGEGHSVGCRGPHVAW